MKLGAEVEEIVVKTFTPCRDLPESWKERSQENSTEVALHVNGYRWPV